MKKWDYLFGVSLPKGIVAILEKNLLRNNPPMSNLPGFEKDAFGPDGFPKEPKPDTIYPSQIHRIVGIPVPETLLDIEEEYRRTASEAALQWLEKVLDIDEFWYHNGLSFQYQLDQEQVTFSFPTTEVAHRRDNRRTEYCAVIPCPDTAQNDEDWENGMIPPYAEQQAQLLMWCHHQYAHLYGTLAAEKTFLVRITGNTAADNTVRTVSYDPMKAIRLLKRISKAIKEKKATGKALTDHLVVIPKRNWKDERQQALDDAYQINDPGFYDLLSRYMEAKSTRKRLEDQAKEIEEEMKAIAISLAAQTNAASQQGRVDDGTTVYLVSHTLKRKTYTKISADLLRQLAPEYTDAINSTVTPRGRFTIEVL